MGGLFSGNLSVIQTYIDMEELQTAVYGAYGLISVDDWLLMIDVDLSESMTWLRLYSPQVQVQAFVFLQSMELNLLIFTDI